MKAGYSVKPLAEKLGVKRGFRVLVRNAPDGYPAALGMTGVVMAGPRARELDMIVFFSDRASQLERALPGMIDALKPAGMLWVAWPKKTSGVPTDLTEDVIRRLALAAGVVDVKVCAISEVWSGLKLVRRVEDR
ncbi:MAG TPA: DUF3052 domain-containing protein [Gemmatimonadaceae bacterium]|nr:DUF3052 domain-containing protein [Gemmatimonadaceae bacterium]